MNTQAKPERILVAVDHAQVSLHAVERAAALARRFDAQVTALHVEDPAEQQPPTDAASPLRSQVEALLAGGDLELGRGTPAEEILREARSRGADLVVLGAHGRHAPPDERLGATVEQVVRHIECPVLVVRSRVHDDYRRLLVAIDYSRPSTTAFELAASWFEPNRIEAAHAFAVPGRIKVAEADPSTVASLGETVEVAERRRLREFVASFGMPDPIPIQVGCGLAPDVLPDLARRRNADLLVLGSHGMSGARHALLGSVAYQVLRRSLCDVLVVS